jgi:hypothetical protein
MEAPVIRPWPAVHYSYPISFSYPLQHLLNIWFHPTLVFFIHVVLYNYNTKREFPMPAVASIPYQPINVDYLEGEFSGHGVTFEGEGFGDSCVAKMGLENGNTAILMLPSGLITSYKTPMWHGGTVELLHTSVSKRRMVELSFKQGCLWPLIVAVMAKFHGLLAIGLFLI